MANTQTVTRPTGQNRLVILIAVEYMGAVIASVPRSVRDISPQATSEGLGTLTVSTRHEPSWVWWRS